MIEIVINGETKKLSETLNLRVLLKELDLPTERIAIELNKDVVRRKDWSNIKVGANDRIEIIHFVGGG